MIKSNCDCIPFKFNVILIKILEYFRSFLSLKYCNNIKRPALSLHIPFNKVTDSIYLISTVEFSV